MPTFDKLRQINVVKAAVRAVTETSRNTLQGRPYKGFLLGESRRRNKEKALVCTFSSWHCEIFRSSVESSTASVLA